MPTEMRAQFAVTSWAETPFDDDGGGEAKLTEALVGKSCTGDIEGTSTTRWLMAYAPDQSATFVGLERIQAVVAAWCSSTSENSRTEPPAPR